MLAFVGLGSLSLVLFSLAFRLFRSDSSVYNSNRAYNKKVSAALKVDICGPRQGARDFRCAAGMAYNKKTGKIVFQSKLSNEAIQYVVR